MISIVVYGIAAPQGSKAPYGGESNPRTKPWRAAVTAEAAQAMNGQPLLEGALKVRADFFFPRPKSHYRTGSLSGVLRDQAPDFHAGPPDGDKLARAIGDSLQGVVCRNDSQIAQWRITKRYADSARCELEISEAA